MSRITGLRGARFTSGPLLVESLMRPIIRWLAARQGLFQLQSKEALAAGEALVARLAAGEAAYLVGLSMASHNTGVALVRVDRDGVTVLSNDEEERFRAEKHCDKFPYRSLNQLGERLAALGLDASALHAVVGTWDYVEVASGGLRVMLEQAPRSVGLFRDGATLGADPSVLKQVLSTRALLAQSPLFLKTGTPPVFMVPHHDAHAHLAYSASPFVGSEEATLVTVCDGFGDSGSISIYTARNGQIELLHQNNRVFDSLGILYGVISSTQGGWTVNSSEGRYMGAAAWGDRNRLTNHYYRELRQILELAPEGELYVNRRLAGWHRGGLFTPYQPDLEKILGPPIPPERMWNPDAVLKVEDIQHEVATVERVNKAAALQMVFEDGLFHVVDHWLRKTGASRLVLTGGTALNCVANMRLLEHFDETYFRRYLGKECRLQLYVPPTPGDAGNPMGAAVAFAMKNGVRPSSRSFTTAYLCGAAPTRDDVRKMTSPQERYSDKTLSSQQLTSVNTPKGRQIVAELMARIVCDDGIIGIMQGPAETGPRALGNRSILANPCNAKTLENLNAKVKFREAIRPLAPMVTLRDARRLFCLSEGASADEFAAYDFMILTVPATAEGLHRVPAVVHEDGTSRIQIVREEANPLIFEYLKAMGRRSGVEVSVNTSLNVGAPIAQTAEHCAQTLCRANGMDGVIIVDNDGMASAVWVEESASRLPEFLREAGFLEQQPAQSVSAG